MVFVMRTDIGLSQGQMAMNVANAGNGATERAIMIVLSNRCLQIHEEQDCAALEGPTSCLPYILHSKDLHKSQIPATPTGTRNSGESNGNKLL